MIRFTLKVLIAVGIIALIGGYFVSCRGHHFAKKNPERLKKMISSKVDDTLKEIDATGEQKEKITAIKDRLIEEGMKLHEQGKPDRKALITEWKKEKPDMGKIRELIDKQAEAKREFAHKIAAALAEVHDILTPEQIQKLAEMAEKHMPE